MRIAVVSDVHGNLTALDAVIADLRKTAPDLIVHGGDLADSGSSPVQVVDRIRGLGWPGVIGNTDEMLVLPEIFEAFTRQVPTLQLLWGTLREMAAWTRDALQEERLAWLRTLPQRQIHSPLTLLHASPESRWQAPGADASDEVLTKTYGAIETPLVVYGHLHKPWVRPVADKVIANSGSVGMPYDGDPRASYLLLDDGLPVIRRVEYNLDRELQALKISGLPYADWVARQLTTAAPGMP